MVKDDLLSKIGCKLITEVVDGNTTFMAFYFLVWQKTGNESRRTEGLRDEAISSGKLPLRNISEQSGIEQARIENRREADMEDKTPSGDAGVEDNTNDDRRTHSFAKESNY